MITLKKIFLFAALCALSKLHCLDLVKIATDADPKDIIATNQNSFYYERKGIIIITVSNDRNNISGRYIDFNSKKSAALPDDTKERIFTLLAQGYAKRKAP